MIYWKIFMRLKVDLLEIFMRLKVDLLEIFMRLKFSGNFYEVKSFVSIQIWFTGNHEIESFVSIQIWFTGNHEIESFVSIQIWFTGNHEIEIWFTGNFHEIESIDTNLKVLLTDFMSLRFVSIQTLDFMLADSMSLRFCIDTNHEQDQEQDQGYCNQWLFWDINLFKNILVILY